MKKRMFLLFGLVLCLLLTACNKGPAGTTGSTASTTRPHVTIGSEGATTQPYVTTTAETTTSPKPNNPPITYHTTNYEIQKNGEKYYIVLETPDYYEQKDTQISGLHFESMADFYDKVMTKRLTESDLVQVVKSFTEDSVGIIVCDFSDLSVPVYPENAEERSVGWYGDYYALSFEFENTCTGNAFVLTSEEFLSLIQENSWEGKSCKPTMVEGHDAMHYYSGSRACIQYELQEGEKTLLIREVYHDIENGREPHSDDELYFLEIFCVENDRRCVFRSYDVEKRPSIEWLKGFGVEKYVPPVEE